MNDTMAARRTTAWLAIVAVLFVGTGAASLLHLAWHAHAETPRAGSVRQPTTSVPGHGDHHHHGRGHGHHDHDHDHEHEHGHDSDCPTCDFLDSFAAAALTPVTAITTSVDAARFVASERSPILRSCRLEQARAPPISIV